MDWIKKLKGLFGFKIDLRHFITINNNHIHITNSPSEKSSYKKVSGDFGNKLILNVAGLTDKQRRVLRNTLKVALGANVQGLLKQEALNLIEDIRASKVGQKFDEIYKILKTIMPSSDIPILKSCLYLQEKFEEGGKEEFVAKLKRDIVERFGDRGAKIANLCSAKYFDNFIVPLFTDLKDSHAPQQLTAIYNLIIEQSVFAVFVSSMVRGDKLKKKIIEKIESNRRYGIKFVNVHGIGKENVTKIIKILDSIKTENPGSKINVSTGERTINARISFE